MTILTILKRSTAVVGLAALPLALEPAIASAQSQTGRSVENQSQTSAQRTQSDAVRSDEEIDPKKPQEAVAPEGATKMKNGGKHVETSGKQEGREGDAQSVDHGTEVGETGEQTATQAAEQNAQTDEQGSGADQQKGHLPAQQAVVGEEQDMIVAKVGGREIRHSDVVSAISMLPPQLQQQPPEMLIPIALDQLVMRELILQRAEEAGVQKDPAATSLAEGASKRAVEDTMVRVWLEKKLGQAVTDEKVRQTYDAVREQLGDEAPSMQVLRPQIEQELRQQAFLDLSRDLQADAKVTLYGPDGQPMSR